LALVEAQQYSDNLLKTYIGTHDGDVYTKLYDYASKENSLNHDYPELIQKARDNVKKMSTYAKL
jgi:Acyl-CoA oxidase